MAKINYKNKISVPIEKRILNIQNELELLKRFFIEKPNFDVDEKNWRGVKPKLKKAREKVYRRIYAKR